MKKYLILFLCLILLYKVNAQTNDATETEVGITEHLGSVITLDYNYINDKNEKVTLRQLINKPTIFSFVYFDCPNICSPYLEGVGQVISKTDLKLGTDYQVITLSFNYRDTPEKAKEKKENFTKKYSKGNTEGWIFLTTDSITIFKTINAFGYKVKVTGFDFVHPSAIVAVSPTGKITRYLYGIEFLPFDFKMAITEAAKEQARPSIQKVLQFCYSYDPKEQRYALDFIKLTGVITLIILVIFAIVLIIRKKRKNNLNGE